MRRETDGLEVLAWLGLLALMTLCPPIGIIVVLCILFS